VIDFWVLYTAAVDETLEGEEFTRVLAESPELSLEQLRFAAQQAGNDARSIVRNELNQLERAEGRLFESERLISRAGGRALRVVAGLGLVLTLLAPAFVIVQTAVALVTGGQAVVDVLADNVGVVLTALLSVVTPLLLMQPHVIRGRLQRQAAEELDIEVARIDVGTALARLEQALRERAVKPELRVIVNSQIEASWSTEFGVSAAPGLRELSDPAFEVSTSAREELTTLLASRGSGSIGVAGPRGAGKTTLINALTRSQDGSGEGEAIGVVLSAPVRYEPRDFLLHLFANLAERVCGQDAAARDQVDEIAEARRLSRRQLARLILPTVGRDADRGREDGPSLTSMARRELRNIRFQQTFSSGWSGSLKLPAGAGLGADATVSLAQSQMTLPEVAARFVAFATKVAKTRPVVIGIDELDKMESEETARQFVNDVKSVLQITGCFYLISISEDAMSEFDRRGMPFRDVFDSSLDEVFYVPYLRLDEGQRLLRSRVIALSVPFQCLCFALSGGLARDLVRVARQLVACHRDTGETALSALAAQILDRDVATKNRASVVAARRTCSHPCVGLFTNWLREGEGRRLSPSLLESRIAAFDDEVGDRLSDTGLANGADGDRGDPAAAIRRVGSELIGYYYFAATAMSLFDRLLGRDELRRAMDDGTIDRLASARQDLAISPLAAWTALSDLREDAPGLTALDPPDVLLGPRRHADSHVV
jgi:hypothetical protein